MKQVALPHSLIVMLSSLWWSKNIVCIRPSTQSCAAPNEALHWENRFHNVRGGRRQYIDLLSNEHQSFRPKLEQGDGSLPALSCVARKTCSNRTLDQKPVRHHISPPSWEVLICDHEGGSTGKCFDEGGPMSPTNAMPEEELKGAVQPNVTLIWR